MYYMGLGLGASDFAIVFPADGGPFAMMFVPEFGEPRMIDMLLLPIIYACCRAGIDILSAGPYFVDHLMSVRYSPSSDLCMCGDTRLVGTRYLFATDIHSQNAL
jgi:hypothetical protein